MVAVIGDIHGCYKTFLALLDKVYEKYPDILVYCVGDLVDRGNYSFEVVKYFMENKDKVRFTIGNHDVMFYAYIKEPNSLLGRAFLYNGSEQTLSSYLNHSNHVMAHIEFLVTAPFFFNLNDCFISHAGISSNYRMNFDLYSSDGEGALLQLVNSDYESDNSIIWTRDKLKNIGKLQIVGHTRQSEARFDNVSNALYIDTGAYNGRKLSCAIISSNEVIDIISERTIPGDIK
jgi:serine/threonine protein phosphatase 1